MRKRIEVSELRIGMYVCELDCSWIDSPFLFHRFVIRQRKQIEALRRACRHVTIDPRRGVDVVVSNVSLPETAPEPTIDVMDMSPSPSLLPPMVAADEAVLLSLEEELGRAGEAHDKAFQVVERLFEDARLGRSLNMDQTRETVKALAASVVREPHALLCLSQLKARGPYTAQHSLNVAIFTLVFARYQGLSPEVQHDLGLGALLHDIGKLRVPDEIINKPDKLSRNEFELAKRHPHYGKRMLEKCGLGEVVLDVVYNHHERVDGSGYPRGLKGREISLYARMVGMIDVYDAVTSPRVYGDPVSSQEAMRMLYKWRMKDFGGRLVEQFIHCLGVYPAGSLVEMDSGEVALVVQVNEADRTRPVVKLLLDGDKHPLREPPLIDLTRPFGDRAPMTIERVLDPLEWKGRLEGFVEESPPATAH